METNCLDGFFTAKSRKCSVSLPLELLKLRAHASLLEGLSKPGSWGTATVAAAAAALARSANQKRSRHTRGGFMIRTGGRETKGDRPASQL